MMKTFNRKLFKFLKQTSYKCGRFFVELGRLQLESQLESQLDAFKLERQGLETLKV